VVASKDASLVINGELQLKKVLNAISCVAEAIIH